MRRANAVLAIFFMAAVPALAQNGANAAAGGSVTDKATYVDAAQVAATFVKGGRFATGPDYSASVLRRTAAGQVEVHVKETDILYVVDGEATFVTGGTMIGGKTTRPDQLLGTDIAGGETHHLKKGDFIAVPAGVPHWFKEVPQSVNYYIVKVIKP